jgi:hypothetical protein
LDPDQFEKLFRRSDDPAFDPPDFHPVIADQATLNEHMLRSNWGTHCPEKFRMRRAFREMMDLAQAALD